jgi:hypothetical protein
MNMNEVLGLLGKRGIRRTSDEMARYGILRVARRLALSEESPCRWVGKDAVRELCRFHTSSFDKHI